MSINENELMSRKLKICENCEWCVFTEDSKLPKCLLSGEEKGLFEYCDLFKNRTGMHISL